MSWLLSMYGDEDDPGEQENTYLPLVSGIIDNAVQDQVSSAGYAGLLENTPKQVIDPTPDGLDPLKVAGGIAAAGAIGVGAYYGVKAVGSGLNFGYNSIKKRLSPEQEVKKEEMKN